MAFIQLDKITKKYSQNIALEDVSFRIERGRCVGLIGVNGAGKTTTLKILSGLLRPTEGNVYYNDKPIAFDSFDIVKRKIGYLSQYPKFYDWMTGYEFLAYMADLYGISNRLKRDRIYEVLEIVNLTGSEKRKIKGYSGGMKQRLGIAQAILHKPEFLILDEPVSALDPEGRHQIIQLLQKLKKETTILLSTHILHDADSICDDVIVLHQGKKIIETELLKLKKENQEPLIKVTFTKDIDSFLHEIMEHHVVEDIMKDRAKQFTIRINDREKGLTELPGFLIKKGLIFESFQVFEPSLEDIFLKLVRRK